MTKSPIFLVSSVVGFFACTSLPSRPHQLVPWSGKFVSTDHRYDLYLESSGSTEPDLIYSVLTPSGKSKDDPDSVFRLFRTRGDAALSTHVRKVLENSCPQEMHRNFTGIQLEDHCGAMIDYSGFYEWIPTEEGVR